MPKHLTLPMTVRHLTGNAEVATILNRYGHGQSYSRTLELETAMCNYVTSFDSILPITVSRDNNAVLHLCYDNFDLDEETHQALEQHTLPMALSFKRFLIQTGLYL